MCVLQAQLLGWGGHTGAYLPMRRQLDGAVVNASCTTPLGDAPEHLCCVLIRQDVHVHGEHQHAGFDGPYMQVMNVFHPLNGVEAICKQQTSTT